MSTAPKTIRNKCHPSELKMLGDYWTLEIIQSLAEGKKRFCGLERSLPTINPTTLTDRLKRLESQKVILRDKTRDKIPVIYGLTPKGKDIIPILDKIKIFADKYPEKSGKKLR